ncbi:THUMP domain-containing protein [Castellaniella sp.]|uniref:THUMP domain-containing protein n=1 Tax=Castellaniella sp. TaxID=1955812 RepID=UPI002AFDF2FB|nr:THUMP domain-containing protein [Castellaniella sp.]
MSDTSRKTLSLKPRPSRSSSEEDQRPKRTGARARQAAIQERAQQARGETPDNAPRQLADARPPRRDRDTNPDNRPYASASDRPRADAQRREGRSENNAHSRRDEQSGQRRPYRQTAERTSERPDTRYRNTGADEQAPARLQHLPRQSRQPRQQHLTEIFPVFAPCPHGLEDALTLELQALGYDGVRAGRAGCHFQADWMGVMRANLYSRLATRILVQVAQADVQTEDDILALARETEWERWFGAEQTLRVDTSAIHSPMRSLQYCNLRAKDGICDRLREREGERPSIDTVRPDARVHLFLDARQATLYLDVSGESLFKRGWRLDKGEAPLRENLAAGLLALSDWTPDAALLDPFCGSGTILIEAAWIALGVPPGIWRPFGFERLRSHDARRWRDLKDDARARIAPRLDVPLVGSDIHPAAIESARANLDRAHLSPDAIRFEACDARRMQPPAEAGWIVTNPPYGERLGDHEQDLWPQWATQLKQQYGGWQVNIITSDLDLPGQLRLKPRRRHPLHNGALDCRLFQFELVSAGYRDRA